MIEESTIYKWENMKCRKLIFAWSEFPIIQSSSLLSSTTRDSFFFGSAPIWEAYTIRISQGSRNINIVKQKWLKIQGKWPWSPGPHSNNLCSASSDAHPKFFICFLTVTWLEIDVKTISYWHTVKLFWNFCLFVQNFSAISKFKLLPVKMDYRTTPGCTTDFVQLLIYY